MIEAYNGVMQMDRLGADKAAVLRAGENGAIDFEVLALPLGSYSVTVTHPGFRPWTLEQTQLTVGERKRLSPKLERMPAQSLPPMQCSMAD